MMKFTITIMEGEKELSPFDDNVDVEIKLDNGKLYSATFFTIENIKSLLYRYQKTGECSNGLYLWASDMIIVNELTEVIIRSTVADLIENGEISSSCTEI